ncbi:non-ribosomal peptide synthetase [Cupriavidus plantarum]|uniref:non-ribosomal peptide synthetase n=1 Tax=Cupriavidus plantarum TaxID=942865 RepID=UPI001B179D1D|nr:non-ribosomal peptide synthetase [Cupriavidus plantarum]CAG2153600.1 Linear gramicidin synthase subunit D [Cupriavidus plantarum]SMR86842.1 non-ribosomal peptide synthase domain TIGR01720/amino acid adenylation domain-containing protein [Cupriavidus plantarum]
MAGITRETLLHHLLDLATTRPNATALTIVDDAHANGIDYGYRDLMQRAARHARALTRIAAPGDRVMLVLDTGIDYVSAFFGCLLARMIAVPAFPPESMRPQHLARLDAILADCDARVAVIEGDFAKAWAGQSTRLRTLDVSCLAVDDDQGDDIAAGTLDGLLHGLLDNLLDSLRADDIAFLQYTSGSTATPKGVMVSHANIMANEAAIAESFGTRDDDVMLSWLPLYHDMGLIGGLMHPLYAGVRVVLMSPGYFLRHPRRWLDAISRFRATISGGPDFAYRLCVDRIRQTARQTPAEGLDLSCWRIAFCGAEPIRAETMTQFAERFADSGFASNALYPCYGMAEATLLVTGSCPSTGAQIARFDAEALAQGRAVPDDEGSALVAGGIVPSRHAVDIRDVRTGASLPDGAIGEICMTGPSVTRGYWQRPDATAEAFLADGALRSGDLGFRWDGQLFIAGRRKDLIIVRGANVYPQDVEIAVERTVDAVRRGRVAAFPYVIDGVESIGIAAEVARGAVASSQDDAAALSIAVAIRAAVSEDCGEAPVLVLLLRPGQLPRTTSGKLQRSRCVPAWKAGELDCWAAYEGNAAFVVGHSAGRALTPAEAVMAEVWEAVLGVRPGPDDHFFALGGNSVQAAHVVARVRERGYPAFALAQLFAHPTLAACAEAMVAAEAPVEAMDTGARKGEAAFAGASAAGAAGAGVLSADRTSTARSESPSADAGAAAPLSPIQRGLWVLWCMAPDSAAYNVCGVMQRAGRFDTAALQAAIDTLAERHTALRTQIVLDGASQPLQRVLPASSVHIDIERHASREDAERAVRNWSAQPFALKEGPAFRVLRVSIGADNAEWVAICVHHLFVDGWSMNVMVDEFCRLYEGNTSLPSAPRHTDIAATHAHALARCRAEALAYWKRTLGPDPVVLELPTDRPRPAQPTGHGDAIAFAIDATLASRLRNVAMQQRTTLFTVLLSAWHALLHRYAGQRDIRIGVPFALRDSVAAERSVGYFISTQTIRACVDGPQPFTALLRQVGDTVREVQPYLALPFDEVVDALQPDRTLAHNPLFQVKFNLGLPVTAPDTLAGDALRAMQIEGDFTRFDLALDILDTIDGSDALHARLAFATDLFDRATIERMARHYLSVLTHVAAMPDTAVALLPLGGDTSRLDGTPLTIPPQDIMAAWDAALQRDPDAPALCDDTQTLTRAEADALANGVALALRARGIGREDVVAIDLDRSVPFVVALIGTLKAGAVALPLDVAQPVERRRQLVAAAHAGVVIGTMPLGVDHLDMATLEPSVRRVAASVLPQQGAYQIYTSGSTGTPKGVIVSRESLAHYVAGVLSRLALPRDASMAMVSTPGADLGHTVLFGALYGGHPLHLIAPSRATDGDRLAAYMTRHRVGVLKIVPSHLRALLHAERGADVLPEVALILGGEATSDALIAQVRALRPACRIFNHYGPTETTVGVLTHALADDEAALPLGAPLPGVRAYVLDAGLTPLPEGMSGELYIGGAQLARGYRGAAGRTAERFFPDPFVHGARMYRTGDRVRVAGGRLLYLGRADEQVKIRGYRVEPAEVAQALRTIEGVGDAAVVVVDGRLIAYAVLAPALDAAEVLRLAAARMPAYLVPAQVIALERLPVTSNGKLDRRALPAPVFEAIGHVDPADETERVLAGIWQDVLHIERVGVTDNFFELGGDSILSIQAVSRARRAGLRFTPKDLFQHQTVRALATVVTRVATAPVKSDAPSGDVPLLPVQQAFLDTPIPARHHWNQAVLLRPTEAIDLVRLQRAVDRVVAHHDALRMRFSQRDGEWTQRYADTSVTTVTHEVVNNEALTDACTRAQQSLNLEHGPLLRVALFTLPDGSQRLLVAIHHLVVDGVSWRILLEDLQQAYNSDGPLPTRTSSYQAWASRVRQHAESLAYELPYWRAQHGPGIAAPDDVKRRDATVTTVSVDATTTRALLTDAHGAYRTQINDLLLAAVARAVGKWQGHASTAVLLEGHGREGLFDDIDLSRTVGWFTTVFPVALPIDDDTGTHIKRVKEALRAVPRHGIGFGLLSDPLQGVPRPSITFNYLGQFDHGADALFAQATESPGESRDPDAPVSNAIVIDGVVRDGALTFTLTLADPAFAAFGERLHEALGDIVAHCMQAPGGSLTPSDVPLSGLTQAQLDALPGVAIEDIYPLSPMQQGILFHALYAPDSAMYVNQIAVDLGGLDAERMRHAWNETIARHDILRTSILHIDGTPLQALMRSVPSPVVIDADSDAIGDADALAMQDRSRPFSLDTAPLMRVRLVAQGDACYRMIWTSHHLLLDGWSTARLIGEVLQRYHGLPVEAVPTRYRDHIAWLQAQDASASEAFWQERLPLLEAPTLLAQAMPAPEPPVAGHAVARVRVDAQMLQRVAQQQRVTLNTLLQAAWIVVLQRYTGQRAVAFGATVAGRPASLPGAEAMLGLFINTLPVIQAPAPDQRIDAWLQALQQENLSLREHEHVPLYEIQRWANRGSQHQGGQPLFDSILVFENYPVDAALREREQHGLRIGAVQHASMTNYPVTLVITGSQTLDVAISYDTALFEANRVEQVLGHFIATVERIADDPRQRVADLVLDRPETVAAEDDRFRHAPPVHVAIARRAAMQPDAVAVRCGDQALTYRELDGAAERLARALRAHGMGHKASQEPVIGVIIDRSPAMIVRLLAVLKAGAAYLPIDPELPQARIDEMIDGAHVRLLLGTRSLRGRIAATVPWLDMEDAADIGGAALPEVSPQQLAYLIYTSGSTGKAKAVAVEHGPLAMHCHATAEQYGMAPGERELHVLSFSFDGAHERWIVPLVAGAEVVLRDEALWSAERTLAAFTLHGITNAGFPPAYLMRLTEAADPDAPPLRLLSFGGEAISRESFTRVRNTFRPRTLINGYGPTEAVVTPLAWVADAETPCTPAYAPIGRPVGSRHVYLLDADLHPVPRGVTGELYIGGYGLARGYFRRPGLTAGLFLPDPYVPGGRMYRTGDLVRQAADGAIEYVSRRDHQIKIRGYRIEPGEIEARLRAADGVHAAAVLAVPTPQGSQLVAYVVGDGGVAPDTERLREMLSATLPPYMVPAQIIVVAELPVTANGKLDRHALPAPVFASADHVAPRTARESALAGIWQSLLGVERIGIHDNFFELGGHSLLLMQLVSRLHREMGLTLSLRDAMSQPTIAQLAAWIDARPDPQQDTARQLAALDDLMADLEAS